MALRRFLLYCRASLRAMSIAIVIGAVFAVLISIDKKDANIPIIAVIGGLTGFTVWLAIRILMALFQPTLDRLDARPRQFAYGAIFLVAGMSGWILGLWLGNRVFGAHVTVSELVFHGGGSFMLITGGLVVVVGLLFRSFEAMRGRLADSIERLKEHEWAEKELQLARSIQTRLLPPQSITGQGFAIAARNFPAHFVAGDFYDVVQHDDGSIAVIVADVAGKGMGASLIMASVKAVLPFIGQASVEEAMATLNTKLVNELARREFVALAYARFIPADGTLQLANAGFPDPYLVRGSIVQPLSVGGVRLPLGIRRNVIYETLTTTLLPHDRLVFVSDGIPEAPVEGDQVFGYDRLCDALRDGSGEAANEWLEALLARIRREVREPLADDWTAVVLESAA